MTNGFKIHWHLRDSCIASGEVDARYLDDEDLKILAWNCGCWCVGNDEGGMIGTGVCDVGAGCCCDHDDHDICPAEGRAIDVAKDAAEAAVYDYLVECEVQRGGWTHVASTPLVPEHWRMGPMFAWPCETGAAWRRTCEEYHDDAPDLLSALIEARRAWEASQELPALEWRFAGVSRGDDCWRAKIGDGVEASVWSSGAWVVDRSCARPRVDSTGSLQWCEDHRPKARDLDDAKRKCEEVIMELRAKSVRGEGIQIEDPDPVKTTLSKIPGVVDVINRLDESMLGLEWRWSSGRYEAEFEGYVLRVKHSAREVVWEVVCPPGDVHELYSGYCAPRAFMRGRAAAERALHDRLCVDEIEAGHWSVDTADVYTIERPSRRVTVTRGEHAGRDIFDWWIDDVPTNSRESMRTPATCLLFALRDARAVFEADPLKDELMAFEYVVDVSDWSRDGRGGSWCRTVLLAPDAPSVALVAVGGNPKHKHTLEAMGAGWLRFKDLPPPSESIKLEFPWIGDEVCDDA